MSQLLQIIIQDQGVLVLSIVERSGFTHSVDFNCSSYTGSTLNDFPLLIRLDRSVSNFSLKSFASQKCYDLRFYDEQARELEYEIDEIDDANGSLAVWVEVKDLNSSTIISAYWETPILLRCHPFTVMMDLFGVTDSEVFGICEQLME